MTRRALLFSLLMTAALALRAAPSSADSRSYWQVWTGAAWTAGRPVEGLFSPDVDASGTRECHGGDLLRLVTIRRYSRRGQCVRTVDYAYWCRPRAGASAKVRAGDAPACGPTRGTDCTSPLR